MNKMSNPSDYYFKEYGVPNTPLPICMLQLDPADRAVLRIAGIVLFSTCSNVWHCEKICCSYHANMSV